MVPGGALSDAAALFSLHEKNSPDSSFSGSWRLPRCIHSASATLRELRTSLALRAAPSCGLGVGLRGAGISEAKAETPFAGQEEARAGRQIGTSCKGAAFSFSNDVRKRYENSRRDAGHCCGWGRAERRALAAGTGAGQLAQLYALTPFFLCPNIHSKQRNCRTSACPVFDIPLVLCVTSDSHLSVLLRYSCSSLCCLM